MSELSSSNNESPSKKSKMSEAKYRKRKQREAEKIKAISKKYKRGKPAKYKGITDKKLASLIKKTEEKIEKATESAARAEILLTTEPGFIETENPLESTWKVKQKDITESIDVLSSTKRFELHLNDYGPYTFNYSANGRYLLLGGEKGHLAHIDWHKNKLATELNLQENVRDVIFLHNETMFAVAQKKYVFIYDKQGIEIHRLKNHLYPHRLEYLPYHFLLASIGKNGILRYQDTSTGALIAEWKTQLGHCYVMRQNPRNAILHLGHHNGSVTLWSPNTNGPLVKMLCHRGPISDLVVDRGGYTMTTSGEDGLVSIWDIRTYKKIRSYYAKKSVDRMAISQTGLIATCAGPHVQIWKDFKADTTDEPYMTYQLPKGGKIRYLQFCPYEDILGIGHEYGFSSIIIPGAGEANFDTFEANPFETKKQRREATVVKLLEKIQPDMITLNPDDFGNVFNYGNEKKSDSKNITTKKKIDYNTKKFKKK